MKNDTAVGTEVRTARDRPPALSRGSAGIVLLVVIVIALLTFLLLFGRKLGLPVDLLSFMSSRRIFIPAADWREIASPELRFSVMMPGEPAVTEHADGDRKEKRYAVTDKDHRYSFIATASDAWPLLSGTDIDRYFNALRDEAVKQYRGTVLSERFLLQDSVPGKECIIEKDGDTYRSQWYIKGQDHYQLMLISNKTFTASKDADRFFGSLNFLAAASVVAPPPGWVEISDKNGRFSVIMPGFPTREMEKIASSSGDMMLYKFTMSRSPDEKHVVQYLDLSDSFIAGKSSETLLKDASTVDAYNIKGKIVSEQPAPLDHYPGRELQVENPGIAMRIRLFLVDRRLYKVLVMYPRNRAFSSDDELFLASFRLIE